MKSVDTSVVLRLFRSETPHQREAALEALSQTVLVPQTVLLEMAWVLTSVYRYSREDAADALLSVLDYRTVYVQHAKASRWAIARFRAGADVADMFHLVESEETSAFVTFDRRMAAQAGPNPPVPIETLA